MDVESVTAELLVLRPAEFTAARDQYVARARKAGDKELATAVTGWGNRRSQRGRRGYWPAVALTKRKGSSSWARRSGQRTERWTLGSCEISLMISTW
nr:hypothetical protein OG409_38010 [Streptomyces sp. NBC_00974]